MKTTAISRTLVGGLILAGLATSLVRANPVITSSVSNVRTTDSVGAYYVPIKTDLANSDQPTFGSLVTTYPNDWNGGNQGRLNDGIAAANGYNGNKWNSAHHSSGPYPSVITFTFNTTLNPNGYDISSVVGSSADWRDGRYWQKYLLEYHTVGGGWTSVVGDPGAYTVNRPGGPAPNPQAEHALVTVEGLALTHVDQLRFTTPGSAGPGCTAWGEIDILGAASGNVDAVWSSTGTDAWETSANWSGGAAPGASDNAVFNGSSAVLNVTPDAGRSVRNLTFDAAAGVHVIGSTGGNALSLASGGNIRLLPVLANSQIVNAPLVLAGANAKYAFTNDAADSSAVLVVGGGITGDTAGATVLRLDGSNTGDNILDGIVANGTATTVGIAKYGTGTWVLAGTNAYTGTTTLGGGTLRVDNADALGNGGDITFAGGTLRIGSPLHGGTLAWGARIKNSVLSGAIAIDTNGNNVTLSGNLPNSNTGGLNKIGAGTLVLTGNNNHVATSLAYGTIVYGGTLALGGGGQWNSGSYNEKILIQSGALLQYGSSANQTMGGVISGAGGLAVTGSGTLTLSGANSFSGQLTVEDGTLKIGSINNSGADGVLGNSTLPVVLGKTGGQTGTLRYTGNSSASTKKFSLANGGVGAFQVDLSTTVATLSGQVDGGGALTKTGAGTLALAGTVAYSGDTTVATGTLALSTPNSNNDASAVNLTSGAILALNFNESGGEVTETVARLFVDGVQMPAGVYGASGSGADPAHTDDTRFSGVGTLTVTAGPGGTPFGIWAAAKGLDGTPGRENGAADDPDHDGRSNYFEFAFNGNPLGAADGGRIYLLQADSDVDTNTTKELILTVAVRVGTPAFSNAVSPTASCDGITYLIEGSTTLGSFLTKVNVVSPVVAGLPDLTGSGYEYRSFSLDGSDGFPGKGFLRAGAGGP